MVLPDCAKSQVPAGIVHAVVIDMVDDAVRRRVHDEPVHVDNFPVYSRNGVACCRCVFGVPLVFDEFLVVGGVYEGEWAPLDGYQACAVIVARQEGYGVCAFEIIAATTGSGGSVGFAIGIRVNANDNSLR